MKSNLFRSFFLENLGHHKLLSKLTDLYKESDQIGFSGLLAPKDEKVYEKENYFYLKVRGNIFVPHS